MLMQLQGSPPTHRGGLCLLLAVLRAFRQGLSFQVLDETACPHVPYKFGTLMKQGDIECWCVDIVQ